MNLPTLEVVISARERGQMLGSAEPIPIAQTHAGCCFLRSWEVAMMATKCLCIHKLIQQKQLLNETNNVGYTLLWCHMRKKELVRS